MCIRDRLWLLGASDAAEACASIALLARACALVLAAQPALVRVRAPAKVLGGVHGQLAELLLLLHAHGFPSSRGPGGDVETCSYVFNGDFVDRGPHQLECAVLMLALKLAYPARVALVRGNHEVRATNAATHAAGALGFGGACAAALDDAVLGTQAYAHVHAAFDWLPAGALLAGGAIAVLHGGLGDGSWGLRELERAAEAARPLGDGHSLPTALLHALWSNPLESDERAAPPAPAPAPAVPAGARDFDAKLPPPFAAELTRAWCEREGVGMVIRSHQCVPGGFRVAHGGRLVTVFSARDHRRACAADARGARGNAAALLLIAEDDEGCMRVRAKVLASADDEVATDGAAE